MDKEIRRHYTLLVDFLGHILGPDYEVALHELTGDSNQIIAISNGELTGRHLGSPLSNKMLEFLSGRLYETQDYVLSFESTSVTGKKMHSNSMFIKDRSGSVVGLLCINFDDSRYLAASENVLRLCHPDIFIDDHIAPQQAEPGDPFPRAVPATTESFHNSIDAVAGDAVGRELIRLGVTADRLTPDERMQIIASLENGGIFLLKGAVKDVADALHCSQASVYRYLSQIKKDDNNSASE